jgi:hypothetical protein
MSLQLLVTANVFPSSLILSTRMMEEIRFSEMSVIARATTRNVQEEDIFHCHRRKNQKSYVALTGYAL